MGVSAVQVRAFPEIRYEDQLAQAWLWTQSPCAWRGRVRMSFREVPYRRLQPAGSLIRPDRVGWWLLQMRCGRHIPPLVVSATEEGTLYLHDGNHRYVAMQSFFAPGPAAAFVRAALLLPCGAYAFQYRWFGDYGTYVLLPAPSLNQAHSGLLPAIGLYTSDRGSRALQ